MELELFSRKINKLCRCGRCSPSQTSPAQESGHPQQNAHPRRRLDPEVLRRPRRQFQQDPPLRQLQAAGQRLRPLAGRHRALRGPCARGPCRRAWTRTCRVLSSLKGAQSERLRGGPSRRAPAPTSMRQPLPGSRPTGSSCSITRLIGEYLGYFVLSSSRFGEIETG
ncbi:hypothetical protein VTK56DRAFT_5855 [Thermocarpiscus australiensis]